MADFETYRKPDPGPPPRPEFPQEQLEAAEQAVRELPGRTAVEIARRVRQIQSGPGKPSARLLPRGRMLAVLGELEKQGKVARRRGQARVEFYPAEEGTSAG